MTDARDYYELAGPLPPLAIPTNLHDSLIARLDRLATVKELAQIGAVIGCEFSHELLAAVADRPQEQLEIGLDQLVGSEPGASPRQPARRDLQFASARWPGDAAYRHCSSPVVANSCTLALRGCSRRRFPAVVETQPELLAYHRTEAGLDERGGCVGASRSRGPRSVGDARGGELAHSGGR